MVSGVSMVKAAKEHGHVVQYYFFSLCTMHSVGPLAWPFVNACHRTRADTERLECGFRPHAYDRMTRLPLKVRDLVFTPK